MITTSYIDENYYIFDATNKAKIFVMIVQLSDNNHNKLANILMEKFRIIKELEQKLFISKNSEFGKAISILVKEKKTEDEIEKLTEETIFKALKYAIQNEKYNTFIPLITDIIKNNISGSIDKLSSKYDIESLKTINKIGNLQKYLESNSKQLTGFEVEGIIFNKDQQLCEFDIKTKKVSSLENYKAPKKLKKP